MLKDIFIISIGVIGFLTGTYATVKEMVSPSSLNLANATQAPAIGPNASHLTKGFK